MSLLDDVLRLVREGHHTVAEIAAELGVSKDEVEGAVKLLESMGYLEVRRLGKEENPCSSCPLRRVCKRSTVQQ